MKRIIRFPNKDAQSPSYHFSKGTTLPTKFEFKSNTPTEETSSSVFELLYDLNYKDLDEYFETGKPDVYDSCGYSLLNRCIQYHMPRQNNATLNHDEKFYDMLVYLLDHGCEVNLPNANRYNSTALHYVLSPTVGVIDHENRKSIVALEGMVTMNLPPGKKQLVFQRKLKIIKLLLERESSNINTSNGFNAVMIAVNMKVRCNAYSRIQSEREFYREISDLFLTHFSLTIRNLVEMNIQIPSRLQLISVKHGLSVVLKSHDLVSKLNHAGIEFSYTFAQELSHQFFINEEQSLDVTEELTSLLFVMQYYDLADFLLYFKYNCELSALGKAPLKSSLNLVFTTPQFGRFEIFCVDCCLIYLDNTNTLNWILPYKIDCSVSRIEGIFSVFQYLMLKPEFNVSQIGPFFIELITRVDSNSELASGIQYLLVRYLILIELWILHRPLDEFKVYHLKGDLIQSKIFSFNTLAHFFLQKFNIFEIIRLKTSLPIQRGEMCSIWKKTKEIEEQDVSRNSELHIFMKILDCLSFQVNNRDESERNTCLHILAKIGRVDCMKYILDYLGAYPYALNSQGNTFLDIYEGLNTLKIEEKDAQVLKNIDTFRHYMSKPFSLRTLSGYVLSKLPNQIIQSINPPHNILHFILLHQKPNPGYEIVELRLTGRYHIKHRESKPKIHSDKQFSASENQISFASFTHQEENSASCQENGCKIKFNPGIIY